jgi:hypothetical protein
LIRRPNWLQRQASGWIHQGFRELPFGASDVTRKQAPRGIGIVPETASIDLLQLTFCVNGW